jgi:hypothetical protein
LLISIVELNRLIVWNDRQHKLGSQKYLTSAYFVKLSFGSGDKLVEDLNISDKVSTSIARQQGVIHLGFPGGTIRSPGKD